MTRLPVRLITSTSGALSVTGKKTKFSISAVTAVTMSYKTPFVASIDEGTQSCKFMVFDKEGKIVASHQESKKQIYPQPGWCEHDPNEIIKNVNTCIDKVCEKLSEMGFSSSDITG